MVTVETQDGPNDSIERVFSVEHHNVAETFKVLKSIDPRLISQIDKMSLFVQSVLKAFGDSGEYDKYNKMYGAGLAQVKANDELAGMLRAARLIGQPKGEDPLGVSKVGQLKAGSFLVRMWLLFRFKRDFHWAVSDLLRQRLTPAKGYLRIQVETVAIMVASTDGSFAHEWLDAISSDKGRNFYNRHHRKGILPIVASHNLGDLYDLGSNASLHSRAQGLMHGVAQARTSAPEGSTGFMYQEMSHPIYIAVMLDFFQNAHFRLIYSLRSAFPELDWSDLDREFDSLKVIAVDVHNRVLALYNTHRAEIQKTEFNVDPVI